MKLSTDELEGYIEQICSGIKIVDIDNQTILFKFPNNFTLMQARRIYDLEYKRALNDGLLSLDDMKKILQDRNVIKEEDRRKLSSLHSKLKAQKVLLAKTLKVKANQDRIKSIIHDLEDQIRQIEYLERSKLSMTADTRAEESKLLYLCWSSAYRFDSDERFWDTQKDFTEEVNLILRQKILSEFILFYSGIPTSKIRYIARSNLWRIRYLTSVKTSESLFGVPTSEYTNDMLNLAYWSHYYQNIYEMMPEDQPSELIIEDDEALDAYLKDYYDEKMRDAAGRKDTRKRRGKLQAFNSQEVIVTRSNELYEDIEYHKPQEASSIKEGNLVKKKGPNTKHRIGSIPDKLPTK